MTDIIDERLNPSSGTNHVSTSTNESVINEEDDNSQLIPLPSLGVSYTGPNYLKQEIAVRPLDWRDEDILTTQNYVEDMVIFDKILDRVIVDKTLKRPFLTTADRDTILLWLRTQEFGPTLEVNCPCVACNHKTPVSWDLEKLEFPTYENEVLDELTKRNGEYLYETKVNKIKMLLKVPSLAEVDVFKKRAKRKNNNNDSDKYSSENLRMIVSGIVVQEDPLKILRDKEQIFQFLDKNNLKIRELRGIRAEFDKIDLKYKTEKTVICENCGYIQEGVSLPIAHKNFFWLDA